MKAEGEDDSEDDGEDGSDDDDNSSFASIDELEGETLTLSMSCGLL